MTSLNFFWNLFALKLINLFVYSLIWSCTLFMMNSFHFIYRKCLENKTKFSPFLTFNTKKYFIVCYKLFIEFRWLNIVLNSKRDNKLLKPYFWSFYSSNALFNKKFINYSNFFDSFENCKPFWMRTERHIRMGFIKNLMV